MEVDLQNISELALSKLKVNRKYLQKLKKSNPKHLDSMMQTLHEKEFEKRNCLDCANCCKTTGPLWTEKDITRVAKHFKMKPQEFEEKYLYRDEEDDLVLQQLPCTFLMADNTCLIYDIRPKACANYPHTDHRSFHKIGHITLKNVAICPAAFNILERLKEKLPL